MSAAGAEIVAPLLATQILWINLLTDTGPALSLGVDPRDLQQMHQPPRAPKSHVISNSMWRSIGIASVLMSISTLFVIDWSLAGGLIPGGGTVRYAQTMAFTTLVLTQLFNVFNARSDEVSAFRTLWVNSWTWFAVFLSLLLQIAVLYVPPLQHAFNTVPLQITDWLVCCASASIVLWGQELLKLRR